MWVSAHLVVESESLEVNGWCRVRLLLVEISIRQCELGEAQKETHINLQ